MHARTSSTRLRQDKETKLNPREVSCIKGGIIVVIIAQGLNLVNGALSLHGKTARGIMFGDPDDGLALDIPHRVFPRVPVFLISDQEPDQHAGIHLAHMQSAQSSSMARVNVLL